MESMKKKKSMVGREINLANGSGGDNVDAARSTTMEQTSAMTGEQLTAPAAFEGPAWMSQNLERCQHHCFHRRRLPVLPAWRPQLMVTLSTTVKQRSPCLAVEPPTEAENPPKNDLRPSRATKATSGQVSEEAEKGGKREGAEKSRPSAKKKIKSASSKFS